MFPDHGINDAAASPAAEREPPDRGIPRVLTVVNDPSMTRTLAINLRARRFDVDTAGTGTDALERAAAHPPDLVILDLALSDLGSTEIITRLVRATAVPIIVMSARDDDRSRAMTAGAVDFLVKPFGMNELLSRIAQHVSAHEKHDEDPN